MHEDKLRTPPTRISKERWDAIFKDNEEVCNAINPAHCDHRSRIWSGGSYSCIKCGIQLERNSKSGPEFEGDFTGGGLMGKHRKEY